MGRLVTARDNHITRWVLPTASRLLIEAACKDAPIRHLDEVVHIEMGQSPSGESCNQDGDGVLLIGGQADLGLKFPNATRWTNQPTKLCRNGDIVICVRATIGEPRWADGIYCLGRGVAGLRPLDSKLDSRFLFRIVEGDEDWLRSQGTGTTFKTISKVHLARIKVPIIPKHEQEQIGSFLDWLEENPGKRPDFNFAPPLPESLSEQRRLVAKIEALAAKIEDASGLRSAVTDLSDSLLKISSKTFFKANNGPTGSLVDIALRITKGESPSWQGFSYQESGPVFIRSENVLWGKLDLSRPVHIPQAFHTKLSRSQLNDGDVLINLVGASIGRACIVPSGIGSANINQAVAVISPNKELLDNNYLLSFLLSQPTQEILHGGKVETARPNISLADLRKLQISLPPLDEQHRIVAYLDALQAQVDALKKLQTQTAAELDALLPAILDRAFNGEL
jgi:type I restriction enzyme, S subunit